MTHTIIENIILISALFSIMWPPLYRYWTEKHLQQDERYTPRYVWAHSLGGLKIQVKLLFFSRYHHVK